MSSGESAASLIKARIDAAIQTISISARSSPAGIGRNEISPGASGFGHRLIGWHSSIAGVFFSEVTALPIKVHILVIAFMVPVSTHFVLDFLVRAGLV
jgi:hypothetical protein